MTRRILSVLLAIMLLGSLVFPAAADQVFTNEAKWIIDRAELIDKEDEKKLNKTLNEICEKYDVNIFIITTDNLQHMEIEEHGPWLYDTLKRNLENTGNVAMLTISTDMIMYDTRMYDIYCDGLPSEALDLDSIMDDLEADLHDNNYVAAFETFAERCEYYIDGHLNGFPFDVGGTLIFAVVIGIVIGLISVLVMKSKLKSVRKQNQANVYVRSGSMQVNIHNDLYLYSTVSRIRKQSSNSSGSGGGPRNAGGRSF